MGHHLSMDPGPSGAFIILTVPRWSISGSGVDEVRTIAPTREAVETAIRRLNNADFNDLYLATSDPETFLGVCGGNGRYMVSATIRNERFAQLVNVDDPSDVEEHIMCGGQLSNFPRRYLVDLSTAVAAGLHYLATGEAAPDMRWEWYS